MKKQILIITFLLIAGFLGHALALPPNLLQLQPPHPSNIPKCPSGATCGCDFSTIQNVEVCGQTINGDHTVEVVNRQAADDEYAGDTTYMVGNNVNGTADNGTVDNPFQTP